MQQISCSTTKLSRVRVLSFYFFCKLWHHSFHLLLWLPYRNHFQVRAHVKKADFQLLHFYHRHSDVSPFHNLVQLQVAPENSMKDLALIKHIESPIFHKIPFCRIWKNNLRNQVKWDFHGKFNCWFCSIFLWYCQIFISGRLGALSFEIYSKRSCFLRC